MQVMVPDYLVDFFLPRLRASDPAVELIPISAEGHHSGSLAEADALYKFYPPRQSPRVYGADGLRQILRDAPRLRWIHSGKAGVEDLLIPELVESDIILTNGAGAPKLPIAETVLAFILVDAKAIVAHVLCQRESRWEQRDHKELTEQTVAILGLGKVGLEIARVCHGLGMRVTGTKLRVTGEPLPNVDEVFPTSRQNECVAQADYVVLAAALTPETRGMVSAATFEVMRPGAAFINVGRGALVVDADLVAALRSQQLRAAYLDVFTTEPLPPDSPYWTMPNVFVMPHNSPMSQRLIENMSRAFIENFGRYCHGQPLINVVDKRAGY